LKNSNANNIFEAISTGASNMVNTFFLLSYQSFCLIKTISKVVLNKLFEQKVGPVGSILSNLIAFLAIFAFIDTTIKWLFSMLLLEEFGLSVI